MAKLDYFQRKLDSKHRLSIPAEVQAELDNEEVVITLGFGPYLHMYSKRVWDAEMEPALAGDILDERIADLNVKFRFGKQIAYPDKKQGRITIEQHLLDHADIKDTVIAVRVGTYWRLMSPRQAKTKN